MQANLEASEPALIADTDAAQLCGISTRHMHRMRAAGLWGPEAVRLGRKVLFRRLEVLSWIEAGCPSNALWVSMRQQQARRQR